MLLSLLLACGTSEPPVAPEPAAPTLEDDLKRFRQSVGRAAKGEAEACAAVAAALELAPRVDAAVSDGSLDWDAVKKDVPGLWLYDGSIAVDWRELSLAAGPGPVGVALVTVGGIGQAACADPARIERWTLRAPTLDKAPPCMRDALLSAFDAQVQGLVAQPCICAVPEPDPTPVIASRLENLGLTDAAAGVREWPTTPRWVECPAKAEPSGD